MGKIPKPCDKKEVPDDPSYKHLQTWKELFNSIDPENITAHLKGDEGFPQYFQMRESRLSDAYGTDVRLFLEISGRHLIDRYGTEIYCCLGNTAFGDGWIEELDENLDTLNEPEISWEDMYLRLVEETLLYQKRIPVPPEKE